MTSSTLYLHALSPVHAGTGQVSTSVVDLPVAREKATNWPVLPATSLKGVLRDTFERNAGKEEANGQFGTTDKAGNVQFGDARLLCFPVRSWQGVFAYAACPLALTRLRRDLSALSAPVPFTEDVPTLSSENAALLPSGSVLAQNGQVWLEDLQLEPKEDPAVTAIAEGIAAAVFSSNAERQAFVQRFVLLSDDVFDFLAENATEVTARVKLVDDTKTVQPGGLWYEEAVPAEAIFVAPILTGPVRGGAVPVETGAVIQIGGKESVGRGLCRVTVATQ